MPKPMGLSMLWLLCIPMLIGCLVAPEEEEDEHEHFPPHWPVTVFAASERLKLIASSEGSIETSAPSVERELVDLITWLPELVADSDMTKAEFDSVDAWATKLSSEGEQLIAKNAKLAELLRMDGLSASLSELQKLCDTYAAKTVEDEGVK
jgi:hypothetical protein